MAARITQRVAPEQLDALLEKPPRAALAWTVGDRIEVTPVAYRKLGGRHLVAVDPATGPAGPAGEHVVLLVDAGRFFFELRAVTLRGRLVATQEAPADGEVAGTWKELVPRQAVAWDYGRLHEEPDA